MNFWAYLTVAIVHYIAAIGAAVVHFLAALAVYAVHFPAVTVIMPVSAGSWPGTLGDRGTFAFLCPGPFLNRPAAGHCQAASST